MIMIILLVKMSVHTAKSPSVSFFRSYLEQRSQRVYVNGEYSSEGIVLYGVPQGSVIGPPLFFFINSLPLHVTSDIGNCEMFADSATIDASDTDPISVEKELQKGINTVSDLCSKHYTVQHPEKTKNMLLATRQKQSLRSLNLNLSLKTDHTEQVHEH